ncbi:hypothetical protein, partial [Sphingobium sp.]|uniref:hypothetical protein n=1 Tax=Sphingobium sp. TaxID=1912891 RepID=UPI002B92051B
AERLQRHPDLANRLQSAKLTDGRTLWILRPGGPMPGPRRPPSGPNINTPAPFSVAQLADRWGCSTGLVRKLIDSGALQCFRLAR